MSLGRRRNVYTLGDFQTKLQETTDGVRRFKTDPFERDPFKIHSYNFHYADRPNFPLEPIVQAQRTPNPALTKPFNTVFYNYDFATHRTNKENNSTNSFHEYRRRKYLHDYEATAPNMYNSGNNWSGYDQQQQQQQQQAMLYQQYSQTPHTLHQLQYQPPYSQYQQLQQQQQQQHQQQELPHKQQQQHNCERKGITAFGGNRHTISNGNSTATIINQQNSSIGRGGSIGTAAYGRTLMPHYPTAVNTVTSIYQRDSTNRNRLSRLYGFSAGYARGEQIAGPRPNSSNDSCGGGSGSDGASTTISGGGGAGGSGNNIAGSGVKASNIVANGSRTSLGSLRARSPAGRGLSAENGHRSGNSYYASVLTDKTNCNATHTHTTTATATSTTAANQELQGHEQQQQRRVCLNAGGSDGYATSGVAGCLSGAYRPRGSVQVVHAPAQTQVNVPVEAKRSSTSGCRININIKNSGTDSSIPRRAGSDNNNNSNSNNNVTIKIETDSSRRSGRSIADIETNGLRNANLYYTSNGPIRRFTSPSGRQNNLSNCQSNETLVIDKRISKFSIVNEKDTTARDKRRSQSLSSSPLLRADRHQSDHRIFGAVREEAGAWARDTQWATGELKVQLAKGRHGRDLEERMPSLLPWRLESRSPRGGVRDRKVCSPRDSGFGGSMCSVQRVRSSYDACLKDLHNLKKFNNEQMAVMANKPTSPRTSIAERKLLNTINNKNSNNNHASNNSNNGGSLKRTMSRLSINSNHEKRQQPVNRSQLHLLSQSSTAAAATSSGSRHSLSLKAPASPLKVNINVYTDNLKLLRI